jgi:hypothetical protein
VSKSCAGDAGVGILRLKSLGVDRLKVMSSRDSGDVYWFGIVMLRDYRLFIDGSAPNLSTSGVRFRRWQEWNADS